MNFPSLPSALTRALAAREYLDPTPVQAAVLQDDAAGRDLLVSAQTGSGKTVAFGLAMAAELLEGEDRLPEPQAPMALIVAPTRELAMQVHGELTWLYAETGARILTAIGGTDAAKERRGLASGAHIVVGTPGRLRDHIDRGRLDISALRVLVLDEADEMLDLGFREDLEFILEATPSARRTLLFSATIPRDIADLARRYQDNALRIDTLVRNQAHSDIEYKAIRIAGHDTERAVVNVLRFYDSRATLVFCGTRDGVRYLTANLQKRGFAAVALSGELSQDDRTAALQSLRDGRVRICVATDVAARGLDLPELGLVIHADLPMTKETMTHRSGRTGRAGRKGVCVLLVPHTRRRRAEMLLASANINATWSGPPTAAEIADLDRERLLADHVITEPATEDDLAIGQVLLAGWSPDELAAALVRLYRSRLPVAQDLQDTTPMSDRREMQRREAPRGYKAADREASAEPMVPAIRAKHERPENTTWFRMNVGRKDNADPKWILPLICRAGGVTKKDIGSIKIFDAETKFELDVASVDGFFAAVRASGETETQFEPTSPPGQGAFRPGSPRFAGKRPDQGGFAKPAGRPDQAGYAKPPGRPGFKKPFKAGKPKRAGV
jgi:ATP-dependent RNA helicase DeaD